MRSSLATVVSLLTLLTGSALAQTAAQSPQRPSQPVAQKRPLAEVLRDAGRIDQLLERDLHREQLEPQPTVDDATFLRRAYLQIVGRIPTLAETERFLADQDPDRRHALCDRLLDSPGRTSHFTNYLFDLLRVKSRQRQLSGEPFAHFLKASVVADRPYDQMVRDMLAATGPAHAEGNGATGYLLRDMNMPHDAMANTLRLFLGTRVECAQCHNHPFDHWTQKQFYEMAAFFGGLQYRDASAAANLRELRGELANADQQTRARAVQLIRRINIGLSGTGTGVEQLPGDYQYSDAKPKSPILAQTIFGKNVKLKPPQPTRARGRDRRPAGEEVGSRNAFGDWLASDKNPMFAKVIANRMWRRTFGAGLVEPIDDWKKDTEAAHPAVLEHIEKLIADLGFDLRQFERVLVHTTLFQREAMPNDPVAGIAPRFVGPVLRRMSAEQMWDSLLTMVFDDVDERLRPLDERAREDYDRQTQLQKADAKQILAMVQSGGGAMRQAAEQRRTALREEMARDTELRRRAQPLLRELALARRDGDLQKVAEIVQRLEGMGVPLGNRAGRGREGDLLRASELEQPARPGHLLRQFGQSDRETIEAASDVATVPQVLTLLNGFLDQRVLEGQSALRRDLELAKDGARRVEVAFLTTLNRAPTADEVTTWRREIAIHGAEVVKDLVWVLCNSNEFRFVR